MKKILLLLTLLLTSFMYSQIGVIKANGVRYKEYTTAQIQALPNPTNGYTVNNSTTNTKWEYQNGAWVDTNANLIKNTVAGRSTETTAISGAVFQTEAGITTDGAPSAGELVICSNCSPAEIVTSASITMDGWKMYDDQTADAATITLSDCDPGEQLTVYINRASAPTLAGTGLTFNALPNTTAFAAATEMAIFFEVSYNGTTIDYYYFER